MIYDFSNFASSIHPTSMRWDEKIPVSFLSQKVLHSSLFLSFFLSHSLFSYSCFPNNRVYSKGKGERERERERESFIRERNCNRCSRYNNCRVNWREERQGESFVRTYCREFFVTLSESFFKPIFLPVFSLFLSLSLSPFFFLALRSHSHSTLCRKEKKGQRNGETRRVLSVCFLYSHLLFAIFSFVFHTNHPLMV